MINLSNGSPAAPNGGTNVLWQQDASGDVSAYVAIVKQIITPSSGTLAIDVSQGSSVFVNVNQALTSVSIINPADGQEITLMWQQDATGHAVTLPTNLLGATAVSATASKKTCQKFSYNAADNNWVATGVGVAGM